MVPMSYFTCSNSNEMRELYGLNVFKGAEEAQVTQRWDTMAILSCTINYQKDKKYPRNSKQSSISIIFIQNLMTPFSIENALTRFQQPFIKPGDDSWYTALTTLENFSAPTGHKNLL